MNNKPISYQRNHGTMKNRAERIADAKLKLNEIEQRIKPFQDELQNAKLDLANAERSFDVGEHVKVTKTCKIGCCIVLECKGIVVEQNKYRYRIKSFDDGKVFDVSTYDMKRMYE